MTLAPVFRSPEAVEALRNKGYWARLEDSLKAHHEAASDLENSLGDVITSEFLDAEARRPDELAFLQENFFLILFHSIFRSLDCAPKRLDLYARLNICIRGLVLSGDNLFDDEDKQVLPLKLGCGRRFRSIVQLMAFEGLLNRVLETYGDDFEESERVAFKRNLLTLLTRIGTLEGSEEGGVDEVPGVEAMIDQVHRVRGGHLFSLAFIAPKVFERGDRAEIWAIAEKGISALGTAFQIVDDLVDLEFDLTRNSHNLLVAEVVHHGDDEERGLLKRLREDAPLREQGGWVEEGLRASASRVLERARVEAEKGFRLLAEVGFWFPPEDATLFVRAIAGDAGFSRVQAL